ncbi:hypothetical protein Leryth_011553, partial [Lithospermum erythrorhizon]
QNKTNPRPIFISTPNLIPHQITIPAVTPTQLFRRRIIIPSSSTHHLKIHF